MLLESSGALGDSVLDGQGAMDVITWIVLLTLFAYLNREFEIWRMISEIETYIAAFRSIRDKALRCAINSFKEIAVKKEKKIDVKKIEARIRNLVDTSFITPTDLDPYGIIDKLKHLVKVMDRAVENEVKMLIPFASKVEVENLKDLIGAVHAINEIYKIVDHIYRIGRKFKSLWILMQLSALLPFITESMKAYESSLEAFANGYPVGDSVGPIVAAKFARKHGNGAEIKEVADDTIMIEVPFKDRKVIVIKAKGPAGVTGSLDDAVEYALSVYKNACMVITVDAAHKLESEESGSISDGFGVAIGGLGIEKFNIEKLAANAKVPLYAILIKMSEEEALSVINKKLFEATDKALANVERVIEERSKPGDVIILVGVGNTIGVYP